MSRSAKTRQRVIGWAAGLLAAGLVWFVILQGINAYIVGRDGPKTLKGILYAEKVLNDEIRGLLPEKPDRKGASNIFACARHLSSLSGYENWARFEFKLRDDYLSYSERVKRLKGVRLTKTRQFEYGSPPSEADFFWKTDEITAPILATCGTEHWLFDDENRRVYTLCHD